MHEMRNEPDWVSIRKAVGEAIIEDPNRCSRCLNDKLKQIARSHHLTITFKLGSNALDVYIHPPEEKVSSKNHEQWSEKWWVAWFRLQDNKHCQCRSSNE